MHLNFDLLFFHLLPKYIFSISPLHFFIITHYKGLGCKLTEIVISQYIITDINYNQYILH